LLCAGDAGHPPGADRPRAQAPGRPILSQRPTGPCIGEESDQPTRRRPRAPSSCPAHAGGMAISSAPARRAPSDTPCDDTEALLRLATCPGSMGARRLLEQASPAAALAAGPSLWHACGLTVLQRARLQCPDPALIGRARDWLRTPGRQLLGWHDPDYPPLLRRGENPPAVLFVDGDPSLLWRPAVAVVGSRSPTPGGVDTARSL